MIHTLDVKKKIYIHARVCIICWKSEIRYAIIIKNKSNLEK